MKQNNWQRVQRAFNLPDLYVEYTKDFNHATAQTAIEITEKQVFQSERALKLERLYKIDESGKRVRKFLME